MLPPRQLPRTSGLHTSLFLASSEARGSPDLQEPRSNYNQVRDNGAPIVTDEEDLVEIQGVEKGDEIADDVEDGVAGGERRSISVAVAAKIGGDCSVAGRGEREHLVAP
ncbi:OBERON-like protein [Camellia lanceoleosa]|uniref:OBERON-like protein n=1 Tax=Camellia lanceoleosa TaxID=1840588 RepID=A0ACC0I380_9ERIC|nr:OBERON-like protein [Camellia lanceoleosa]